MCAQLSLKRKKKLAEDLKEGMTEAQAVVKYSSSKGTVGRVRKDIGKYLAMDVDALG